MLNATVIIRQLNEYVVFTDPGGIPLSILSQGQLPGRVKYQYTVECSARRGDMLICDWLIANRRPAHCYLLTSTRDQRMLTCEPLQVKIDSRSAHLHLLFTLIGLCNVNVNILP